MPSPGHGSFLTDPKWLGFEPEKLSVTVYPEDEEAFELWNKKNRSSGRTHL